MRAAEDAVGRVLEDARTVWVSFWGFRKAENVDQWSYQFHLDKAIVWVLW
jgi:hypothetical protein